MVQYIPSTKILKHLHTQTETMVEYITRLVEAESPSSEPTSQQAVLSILADSLSELDYQVEWIPGLISGGHLYAKPKRIGSEEPSQVMIGHCDTVWPIGTLKNMPAKRVENRLFGPGVYDMKAGLALIIFALRALHSLALQPQVRPLVFINSDEEIGSVDSTPHIEKIAQIVNRAFILEPSLGPEGRLKTARKGVGRFQMTIHGIPAHAGLDPQRGASAILELSYILPKLFALNDHDRGITVNVGKIDGGVRSNVIAPVCNAEIDVRVPTYEDARHIEDTILNLKPATPRTTYDIEGRIGRRPLEPTPRNRALWEIAKSLGKSLDLDLKEAMAGGGSDGNTTSQFTATLDGLGAVGDGAHANHEFVFVDQLAVRCALLATLLLTPPR